MKSPKPNRVQFNCRLPEFTIDQIKSLCDRLGLSQSEVVILAIDRMAESEKEKTDAAD